MNAIASFIPGRSQEGCYPSLAAIGERAGIDRKKTVIAAIKELVKEAVLVCERRRRKTSVFKWACLEVAVSAPIDGLEVAESAPISPILEVAVSAPVMVAVSATGKDTREGYKTTIAQNDEKPPSSSAPAADSQTQDSERKPKGNSFPQGNKTPSPTPSPAKVAWDGQRIIVPDTFMESWSEAYPSVDLHLAIRRASAWCLSNPGKRPKKDFARFLNGWFRRVTPSSPEYIDPEEKAVADAELVRGAKMTFDDPDECADFWWRCKCRGEYVPPGVDCRPMPAEKEVAV
jgi:hypothetical protein